MKKNMNTQLLKKLYSIYSPSGKEQKMVRFLCSYINGLPGEISLEKDSFGNLYVTKGSGESYPCLVSHLDQVSHCRHSKDFRAVEAKGILFGYSPSKRRFENLGRWQERHLHLSGMPAEIRCPQGRVLPRGGNRMQGSSPGIHAVL